MRACVVVMVVTVVTMTASGCGQAKHAPPQDPAEAVRVLQRQGYTVPTLPPLPRGSDVRSRVALEYRFDTRYGQPIAHLHKGSLYVMVVRGDSHTPRVPYALWHRSGDTILIGWPSGPSGRAQFNALVEAL
jgi:hypothetical protein